MGLLAPPPTGEIVWKRFDGTPETLPPEDCPVLVYAVNEGDSSWPAIFTLARDERQRLMWQNPGFQDIEGDVWVEVETGDCWGFLPDNPRGIDRGGITV